MVTTVIEKDKRTNKLIPNGPCKLRPTKVKIKTINTRSTGAQIMATPILATLFTIRINECSYILILRHFFSVKQSV